MLEQNSVLRAEENASLSLMNAALALPADGRYVVRRRGQIRMMNSKRVAGLVGPSLAVIVAAEFPLVQPELYSRQIPPVVYLSGVLLFVAGLAIVRAHNAWRRNWTVLVTLIGWFALTLGLVRMFAASQYQRSAEATSASFFMILEAILFFVGAFLTFKAYTGGRDPG
jgi:uncharacterized membrane protein YhaH (DUF805 family)